MKHRWIVTMLAVVLGGLGARGARGDTVRLKGGRAVEGIVLPDGPSGSTTSTLKVRVGSAVIALPRDQVEQVAAGAAGENTMLAAQAEMGVNAATEALRLARKAVEQNAPIQKLVDFILTNGDTLSKALPMLDEASRQTLDLLLSRLESEQAPQTVELVARRLELYLCLGVRARAEALFTVLGPNYLKENPDLQAQMSKWLASTLTAWTKAGDFATGARLLSDLNQLSPELAHGQGTDLYLQWGASERDKGNYEQSLKIYEQFVAGPSPQVARDRVETTLEAAERAARQNNALEGVTGLFETYGLKLSPEFARPRLAQIWRDAGWQHLWANRFDQAQADFTKANELIKDSAKADLAQCEYRRRRAALAADDLMGHYELGRWCMDQNLNEPALNEFKIAMSSDVVGETARGYAAQLQNQMAEADLLHMLDLYSSGHYVEVLNKAHEFMTKPHPVGYLKQAKEIEDLARSMMRDQATDPATQAETLFQQGQRAFQQGRYAEAEELLQSVVERFPNTPMQARAKMFYAMAHEKNRLAKVEKGQAPAEDGATSDSLTSATSPTRMEIDRAIRSLRVRQRQNG